MLQLVQVSISLGIEGIPLACVGADGYLSRLMFWALTPIFIVLVVGVVQVARLGRARMSRVMLLQKTAPIALRIIGFLSYPILTNVGFEACALL